MTTQEQIKNDYSKEQSFENWNDLIEFYLNQEVYEKETNIKMFSNRRLQNHIDAVMKIYAMECLKLASENADIVYKQTESGTFYFGIDEESITNENNIIK